MANATCGHAGHADRQSIMNNLERGRPISTRVASTRAKAGRSDQTMNEFNTALVRLSQSHIHGPCANKWLQMLHEIKQGAPQTMRIPYESSKKVNNLSKLQRRWVPFDYLTYVQKKGSRK